MPLEIERKYLLKNDSWRDDTHQGTEYVQGYIFSSKEKSVRARVAGDKAFITIKASIDGSSTTRLEYEYEIPLDEAKEMLAKLCSEGKIEKTRYKINQEDLVWEIDEFKGANAGLILAEIELEDENRTFALPDWLGEEVTSDVKYLNSNLAKKPFSEF